MPCAEAALDGAGVAEVADVSDTSSQSRPHAPQNEPPKAGRIGQVTDSIPHSQPESPFGDVKVKRLDKELPLPRTPMGPLVLLAFCSRHRGAYFRYRRP